MNIGVKKIKNIGIILLVVLLGACAGAKQGKDESNLQNNVGNDSSNNAVATSGGKKARANQVNSNKPLTFEEASVVHFAFDKSNITSAEARKLDAQVVWLKNNPKVNVTIEGHTDDIGTAEYNLALGERRANATKGYLVKSGISANRIKTVSYGKDRPQTEGVGSQARADNRRTVTIK